MQHYKFFVDALAKDNIDAIRTLEHIDTPDRDQLYLLLASSIFMSHPNAIRCAVFLYEKRSDSMERLFIQEWCDECATEKQWPFPAECENEKRTQLRMELFEALLSPMVPFTNFALHQPGVEPKTFISRDAVIRCFIHACEKGKKEYIDLALCCRCYEIVPAFLADLQLSSGEMRKSLRYVLNNARVLQCLVRSKELDAKQKPVFDLVYAQIIVPKICDLATLVTTKRKAIEIDAVAMREAIESHVLNSFKGFKEVKETRALQCANVVWKLESIAKMYAEIAVDLVYHDQTISLLALRETIEGTIYSALP